MTEPAGATVAASKRLRISHPARDAGKKVVVVVGGGFGGLMVAKRLARHQEVQVLLFDQRNHHLFQPLLYQVASAGLNPADIAVPIRAQFDGRPNVEVHLGRIDGVQLDERIVRAGRYDIEYDYLVLALGAQHSYFGHPEWEQHAPGLKTLEQATEIRRRILLAFESAENELDPAQQEAGLTFVVVGGGPTGVEMAGAIADISRTVIVSDFRRIDPAKARVLLVEAAPRILAVFPEDIAARATRDLEELGVEVRTNAMVESIDASGVVIAGQHIAASTVVWAAGVQATRITYDPPVELDRAGRVLVGDDLSIPGHPEAFVVGDLAALQLPDGSWLPGVSPAAMQGGIHAATTIVRDIRRQQRFPFRYRDKGIMATIGKSRAVGVLGPLKLTGHLAWFAWLFVHVYYLIGFKNRLAVMWQWAWSYLFSKRGARLIVEKEWRLR
jgi:NADH dehydrogenase